MALREAIPRMTAAEFDEWATRPENRDKRLEFIAGEVIELVSNDIAAGITFTFSGFIFVYLREHDIGVAKGPDGGYIVAGQRYMPDIGFIRHERRTVEGPVAYYPVAPDLAVEVISDPDSAEEQATLRIKVSYYLQAGTMVYVVNWGKRQIEVHVPGQIVQIFNEDDTLDGGDVLPGFSLKVGDIFPERSKTEESEGDEA